MNEKTRFMLALITPAALVLLLFQVVPIFTGANASFRDWTLHDPKRTWVGLANYVHVLRDTESKAQIRKLGFARLALGHDMELHLVDNRIVA